MKYLIMINFIFLACINIKKENFQSLQPAGKNYKWWSTNSSREIRNWSVRRNKNILWKVPLEETGQGGIIKVKNRLYFSIMKPVYDKKTKKNNTIIALCYNSENGKKLWQREIKGLIKSSYMYGFSNSSSPTPVSDGENVYFFNASGKIVCYSLDGQEKWSRIWKPIEKIGKIHYPFNKQYEPILYKNILINVEPIGKNDNEGRKKNWHYLVALDKNTGKILWLSQDSLSHYDTPMMGFIEKIPAILISRGGTLHKIPERPVGFSLINMLNGKRIWQKKFISSQTLYNNSWNEKYALWINTKNNERNLHVLDSKTGELIKIISLSKKFNFTEYNQNLKKYVTLKNISSKQLNHGNVDPAWYTNFLKGKYYYYMTFQDTRKNIYKRGPKYSFAKVNLETSLVEYLEVPVDIDIDQNYIWRKDLPSSTLNIRGIDVANDKRSKLSGWVRCFNANPFAVNSTLYFSIMSGMVYIFDMSVKNWDEKAFISINDLGKTGKIRTLSQPLIVGDRIYHKTATKLICIGKK